MANRQHLFRSFICISLAVFTGGTLAAEELRWSETGVRSGYIDTSSGAFRQFEVYAVHPMRLGFHFGDGWKVRSQWELSAGHLEHDDIDSLVFTAGPVLVLRKGDWPWYLEFGSRPTLISEDDFQEKEFGGPIQFTSHGGIGWTHGRLELHYRIQHMSNARIYSENDGLNLHVLEIGWTF